MSNARLHVLCEQLFGDRKYLEAAAECAEVCWYRGLLHKGYGTCHGPAGSGYAMLAMYRALATSPGAASVSEPNKHLYRALKVLSSPILSSPRTRGSFQRSLCLCDEPFCSYYCSTRSCTSSIYSI